MKKLRRNTCETCPWLLAAVPAALFVFFLFPSYVYCFCSLKNINQRNSRSNQSWDKRLYFFFFLKEKLTNHTIIGQCWNMFLYFLFFVDVWLGRIDCYLPALTHSLLSSRSFWGFYCLSSRNPSAHAFCIDDSFLPHFFFFSSRQSGDISLFSSTLSNQKWQSPFCFVFIGWSAPLLAIFVFQLFKFVFGIPFINSLFPSPLYGEGMLVKRQGSSSSLCGWNGQGEARH